MVRSLLLCLALLFCGCARSSLEEYRRDGEALCRSFTNVLQKVQTREDLIKALPEIKKHYEEIANLLIDAHNYKKEHDGEAEEPLDLADALASETLMLELMRIYRMEGGKELMETAQKEPLFKLDSYCR